MEASLESSAILLRGYLLNQQTPPEIENAIKQIATFFDGKGLIIHGTLGTQIDHREDTTESTDSRNVRIAGGVAKRPSGPRTKLQHRCKLDPAIHLERIQTEHDTGAANNTIAKKYDVSDQTIVNFLRQYGTYNPQAIGGRPPKVPKLVDVPSAPSPTPEPTDMLGEPLISHTEPFERPVATGPVRASGNPSKFNPFPSSLKRPAAKHPEDDALLKPADLPDVRKMHAKGGTKAVMAAYSCTHEDVITFLTRHKNAKITPLTKGWAAGAAPNHVVKPTQGY